ncbi:hypothetical protein GOBAR_AA19228 [Gossypium barbadense]|uniref:Uncharacterized protein n=1 Tax=Gossypium barbadense TaxID=3634 RepID=A0A2P5XDK8_GOSBA|nr:hypothetical protein GOBAR_AA19228 [Gossypium barbadense]
MSPEQSQYIWRKTIPHIEVGMGSGVFTSYRSARFGEECISIAKDSIQPQVPLRLPCYDFTPVEDPTVGVTGGVYRARVHIHRGMLIRDY